MRDDDDDAREAMTRSVVSVDARARGTDGGFDWNERCATRLRDRPTETTTRRTTRDRWTDGPTERWMRGRVFTLDARCVRDASRESSSAPSTRCECDAVGSVETREERERLTGTDGLIVSRRSELQRRGVGPPDGGAREEDDAMCATDARRHRGGRGGDERGGDARRRNG